MPIFMDRHNMSGASAEEVADAHRKDLEIQVKYGVRYLTYWFDQQRGTVFCLADAPDRGAAERVHREAHGDVAADIIEVQLSAVEAFLGRIGDPAQGAGVAGSDTAVRAVMFTDIVGSTEMTGRLGDRLALEIVRAHDALVHRSLERCGGRKVKHTGDGIMAAFDQAERALRCAATIQDQVRAYNFGAGEPLHVRIGLDSGEPVADSDDLFGSTVQLAARICGMAEADGILVSQAVRASCGAVEAGFTDLGAKRLKGFAEPVRVFRYDWASSL
jgi:class 3 adenylate cyclase